MSTNPLPPPPPIQVRSSLVPRSDSAGGPEGDNRGFPADGDFPAEVEMSLVDHLEELRSRVLRILLAVVVAFARSGSATGALLPLLATAAWAVLLLVGLRPLRRRLERHVRHGRELGPLLLVGLMAGALLSGAVTEAIGVHLIFGAFLWGLAMPRHSALHRALEQRLQAVVLQLMLPLFFAISGLNTRLTALNSPALWAATLLVLAVAVAGKFLGTWATARLSGVPPREAEALGWLLNTRGLTELVILNVGLSLGMISTTLFSIGVLMAIGTTLMTGPLLGRLGFDRQPASGPHAL